jgi:hypothetical protein
VKTFLKNVAVGVPLALGAVLTLVGASMIVQGHDSSDTLDGCVLSIVGIPLLYATLASILQSKSAI